MQFFQFSRRSPLGQGQQSGNPLPAVQEVADAERWERLPPGSGTSAPMSGLSAPMSGASTHTQAGSTIRSAPLSAEYNPSQKPLNRQAPSCHDPFRRDTHNRASDAAAKRALYAQEGDATMGSEFKEQVAELLQEEEYGVFRLVVPHIILGRRTFNQYVDWLNGQRPNASMLGSVPAIQPKIHRSILGLPMVKPFSPLSLFWMGLMFLVDITWTAFGVPINVAFCSINYGHLRTSCTSTDLSFGIIYCLNLFISFQLGVMVVNGHRKKTVLDGRKVAYYYMTRGRFALDLAATVPFVYLVVVLAVSHGQGYQAKWVNALSLLRLVRLLRLVSVSQVIHIDSTLGTDGWLSSYLNVSSLYVTMVAYQTLVLINFVACILVLIAYMHGLEESWMSSVSWEDVPASSQPYQWYCAIYWVITSATTTGFGDIGPRWWGEQVVINATMILGMIAFGLLVASITTGLARANATATRLQTHIKKISLVNHWLSNCKLQGPLRLRIQEYFAQVFVAKQSVDYGEAELFADLPPYLRFEVASELALPLVQSVHALKSLNLDAQQLIAAHFRPVRAIVGQELCRQGDEADRLWLLASGRLVALRHKEEPQHVSAPALVGESVLLAIDVPQCRYRPWTLRTASPCQLWEVRLPDLSRVLQIYPAIRLTLLEHVRADVVKHLFQMAQVHDRTRPVHPMQDWCELVALLQGAVDGVHGELPVSLDELSIELERANIDDGSLQGLLSELVESSMVRDGLTPEAVLGLPLDVQQQVQQVQQDMGTQLGRPTQPPGGITQPHAASVYGTGHLRVEPPSAYGERGLSGPMSGRNDAQPLWPESRPPPNFHPHRGPAIWDMEDVQAAPGAGAGPALDKRLPSSGHKVQPSPPQQENRSWHGAPSPTQPAGLPLTALQQAMPEGGSPHGQSSLHPSTAPGYTVPGGAVGVGAGSNGVVPMPVGAAGMLPLPPSGSGRPVRRVASHQHMLGAGSVELAGPFGQGQSMRRVGSQQRVQATGSEGPSGHGRGSLHHSVSMGNLVGTPPRTLNTTSTTTANVSPDPSTGGAGEGDGGSRVRGQSGGLGVGPQVSARAARNGAEESALETARQWQVEDGLQDDEEDDPIAREAGLAPHRERRSFSLDGGLQHPQPSLRSPPITSLATVSEAPDAAFRKNLSGRASLPPVHPPAPGPVPLPAPAPPPGATAPPIAHTAAGIRRSMLSRFSSPFATAYHHSISGITGAPGVAPPLPVGGSLGGAGAQQPQPSGPPCTHCGSRTCPSCGCWVVAGQVNQAHPQYSQPPLLNGQATSAGPPGPNGSSGAVGGSGPGPLGGSGHSVLHQQQSHQLNRQSHRPSPAQSLTDAIRGSIRHRSGGVQLPPVVQLPPALAYSQAWGPSTTQAAGGPSLGSPVRALAKRSRMFGRSFAASNRMDDLVRTTLMRDTYGLGTAYSQVDEGEQAGDLASPSIPPGSSL